MYSDNFEKRKKSENITSQNNKFFEKHWLADGVKHELKRLS